MSSGNEDRHEKSKFKEPCGISVALGFSEITYTTAVEFSENWKPFRLTLVSAISMPTVSARLKRVDFTYN